MCLSGRVRPAIGAIQRVGPNCAPRCALESLKLRSVCPSKRLKPRSRYPWRVKGLKSLQRREGATRGNRPCKRSGGSVSRRPTRAVSRCRGARCAHTLPRRTDKPGRVGCTQICCGHPPRQRGGPVSFAARCRQSFGPELPARDHAAKRLGNNTPLALLVLIGSLARNGIVKT